LRNSRLRHFADIHADYAAIFVAGQYQEADLGAVRRPDFDATTRHLHPF
jgi:hypothetical protein